MPPVKPSSQAAIVDAAARLFAERGYQETSVADIAREAGVALQTVYNAVGAKREVLFRVLEDAAAGPDAPTPVRDFMQERTERETDPRRIVALMVEFFAGALARTAPVRRMIREAAALDPEVARREREGTAQRRRNYGLGAALLAERGALRPGLRSTRPRPRSSPSPTPTCTARWSRTAAGRRPSGPPGPGSTLEAALLGA